MSLISQFIDFVLHIDRHLPEFVKNYGVWIYLILFVIIFCETGLVVTPFLPGDSLLFACGAIAAQADIKALGTFRLEILMPLLFLAAFLGDNTNWFVGSRFGGWLVKRRWFRKDYLDQTHRFFEKHGRVAIILARFAPIVRTFAPFTAGLGAMPYRKFIGVSLIATTLWIVIFTTLGYFLGNLPIIRDNIKLVFVLIIAFSLLPILIGAWNARKEAKQKAATGE